jgi:catechol 2,3-dioxygenase-like lactoylglutathione lyase family enzyme
MGLSVSNLDATVAKLRSDGVKFLEQPHPWSNTRAAMVEGPDQVSIEIVEVK